MKTTFANRLHLLLSLSVINIFFSEKTCLPSLRKSDF